jgi:hypothetical protein
MLDLCPISHTTNNQLQRVPLYRKGNEYVVYVGHNFIRTYDENTMPDEVKTKLAMAMAVNCSTMTDDELAIYPQMVIYNRKSFYDSNDMDEIGWRVSESYYCLCLSNDCINEMLGNYVNNT